MKTNGPERLNSEIARRSVIERFLLKEAIEALLLCKFEQENPGIEVRLEGFKIQTPIGSLRVNAPFCTLRSVLFSGHKLKLKTCSNYFLALPFCDADNMRRFLGEILGEVPNDQLLHSFGYELSRRIQSLHTTSLTSDWQSLFLGTLCVTAPSSCSQPLELDYCIGKTTLGDTAILGLWDPGSKEPGRWRNICSQIQSRGLKHSQSVITDTGVGSANAFISIVNPDIGDVVLQDQAKEVPLTPTIILLEQALPEDGEIGEEMSRLEVPIPTGPRAHMSAPSLILPSIAFVLLVIFGGFYSSAKESIASSLSASSNGIAETVGNIAADHPLAVPIERQLLRELKDQAASSDNLAAIIRVAAHSESGPVVNELIRLSEHPDSIVRASVAQALSQGTESSSPQRLNSLVRLLVDTDFLVRGLAAKSLGRIGTHDAMEALQLRLKYENNGVVRRVIEKILKERAAITH